MDEDILELIHQARKAVWRNGYRPIAVLNPETEVKGAGKRPAGTGPNWSRWETDARQDPPHAVTAKPAEHATNTGILSDGLRPVDGDIDDPALAEVIDRLAVEMLGNAPKRYRGDSPRWLRLYRAAEGEPPHAEVLEDETVAAAAGRPKPYGIEVLGKGSQFVAIGHHPDGAFLDWAEGRNPTTVPRNELPAVTETQIAEFLSVVGELLGSKKCRHQRTETTTSASAVCGDVGADDSHPALADVQAALSVIPGDGGSYKVWIRVGMATFAATNGSHDGLVAYDQWSKKSAKYDTAAVTKAWRTFRPSSVSFGSLVHMAREANPEWRAPSWSQRNSVPGIGAVTPPIKLDILNRNVAPAPPLPLAVFGPGWGEWIQQAAVAANAPTDYVATTLLAVAGSLLGNARWGQAWDGWSEPSVLWCGLVGEPSASKTPAANAVLKLLGQVEADMAKGFDETYAAWEEAAARAKVERKQWEASLSNGDDAPMPRSVVPPEPMRPLASTSSVTVEKVAAMMQGQPKGFLVANDELAGWLNNMERYSNGTDRPFWLSAWPGSRYRVDRKNSPTAVIPYLSLGIFGTIQPDRLATALQGADDGLPARFLFCWPEARSFARPRGTVSVSRATEALCKLARLEVNNAEDGSPVPVFVNATEGAAEALTDFAREMQSQERQAAGLMIGVLGKARGYALRLAVVLEFLPWAWSGERSEPTEISGNAMQRAIKLMREYFLPMASRVLGDAAITQQERDGRTLAKWIAVERPDRINLRALSRGETGGTAMHGLRDRKRLDAAAEWIQDCGWFLPQMQDKVPGRPRSDFVIAPGLWAAIDAHT